MTVDRHGRKVAYREIVKVHGDKVADPRGRQCVAAVQLLHGGVALQGPDAGAFRQRMLRFRRRNAPGRRVIRPTKNPSPCGVPMLPSRIGRVTVYRLSATAP